MFRFFSFIRFQSLNFQTTKCLFSIHFNIQNRLKLNETDHCVGILWRLWHNVSDVGTHVWHTHRHTRKSFSKRKRWLDSFINSHELMHVVVIPSHLSSHSVCHLICAEAEHTIHLSTPTRARNPFPTRANQTKFGHEFVAKHVWIFLASTYVIMFVWLCVV